MRSASLSPDLVGQSSTCPADTDDLQDLIMSSDTETTNRYHPPPHIAARFYRNANNRRKSSAASSRRNSMSSQRSNRSSHGGPQSNHLAQHLRRASIIESRRARLADKAAHAEKVRLRAALAKAAPRTSTASEDRAIAAQQAREKYLAQVAASCAEEVKRAKKVAEDMKERKAAEHLRMKGNMEERLAEAERRRLKYQQNLRRARSSCLPVVEEKKAAVSTWKPRNEETAVRVIQKTWRLWKQRRIVNDFMQLGLTVERLKRATFEEVSALLAEEHVIRQTSKMLKYYGLQDAECGGIGESTAIKIFLSAFLILSKPEQVLNENSEQEQDLTRRAQELLIALRELLSRSASNPHVALNATQHASLSEAFSTFQSAFIAWKNHDTSILVGTMVAQFAELDSIWQSVKNNTAGGAAEDYKEGIQTNQTLILVRLKRLVGPEKAKKLLAEAVRSRRGKKAVRQGDPERNKPRSSLSSVDTPPTGAEASSSREQSKPPPTQLSTRSSQIRAINKLITQTPSNRVVIHELAINKDYRIEANPAASMHGKDYSAIFEGMRTDLEAGRGDRWIVTVAESIRDRLLNMITPGKPLHILISETLDPELTERQLRLGSFSYERFFSFMNTILPKLCAPARDADVKALAAYQGSDLIERLAKLMHIIDQLGLDYANHILQVMSPELLRRAPEYEQGHFTEQLQGRKPVKAIRWWSNAREKYLTGASRRGGDTNGSVNLPTADKIYTQGLVDLFISLPPLDSDQVPETLELDETRLTRIKSDILRIVSVSTVLLTAKNLLKRDVRSQWKQEAQRMWDLPEAYDDPAPYLSIIESSHVMPPTTRSQLQGTIQRVLSDSRDSPNISQPVMKVLLQKLKSHVLQRLSAASAEERLRSTTTASEVLAQGGMAEFVGRIGAMVEELGRVKAVDWETHGVWLDQVTKEVGQSS
ncbi:MAG: hypothetical protein MMC33_002038 [Icmadophila ericetorum]|nr:hypothetical protein [Icmadophila ericetorum]